MMKVTIIIPTYNRAHVLGDMIKDSLNQTHPCEILIIDDGSTDSTQELLKEFPTIKKIILKKNSGVAQAMNIGILYASGNAISFHNSDDRCHKNKIKLQVKALKKKIDYSFVDIKTNAKLSPKYPDVAFTKVKIGSENTGNLLFVFAHLYPQIFYPTFHNNNHFIHTNSGLYKKSIFEKIGGFQRLPVMEDTDMINRIIKSGFSMTMVDQALYSYIQSEDSLNDTHKDMKRVTVAKEVMKSDIVYPIEEPEVLYISPSLKSNKKIPRG